MLIVTLRTENPEAEVALFDGGNLLVQEKWQAHRQLAETLHGKIRGLLAGRGKEFKDLGGIVVYHGPGSFTGLRIGLSVANALAASYDLPMSGTAGEEWRTNGVANILAGIHTAPAIFPVYGAPVRITAQKH